MEIDIPKFNIIYSEVIQEITFNFEVEFTLFGEILSITNDFLLQSEEVQEARFREKTNDIVRHLKLAKNLFKYLIPLALMGYLEKRGWDKFKKKFDEAIVKRPTLKKLDRPALIKDNWVKEAWELNEPKNNTLKFLCDLYFKEKKIISSSEMGALWNSKSPFIDTLLFDLIPVLELKDTAGWSYQLFSNSFSPEKLDFLLLRLKNNTYQKYHSSIIQKLSLYNNPEIKKNLIQYYYQNQSFDKDEIILSLLCSAFKNYPDKEVEKILLSLLSNKAVARKACKTLIEIGCTEEQISNHISPIFYSNASLEVKFALLSASCNISANWRPSEKKILNVLVELWKEDEAMGQVPRILLRDKSNTTKKRLIELLNHKNINIKKGVIRQYYSSKDKEDIEILIKAINFNNEEIFEQIFSVLRELFKRHSDKQWVIPFLNSRIYFTHHKDRNLFYRILRELIEKTEFDEVSIIPILMTEFYVKGEPIKEYYYDKTTAPKEIIQIISNFTERDKSILDFFLKITSDKTVNDEVQQHAIRTLGYLNYPNYFELFKHEFKNGDYYKKQGALDGLESHQNHNPFLRQLLIDEFPTNNFSHTTSIINKLFPHSDNIPILEKYFLKIPKNHIKLSALKALLNIPEFIGNSTFYKALQENEQEMIRVVQLWYADIIEAEWTNERLAKLTSDDETSSNLRSNKKLTKSKRNRSIKFLKSKIENTKRFRKLFSTFEKLAETNEKINDFIKLIKSNASQRGVTRRSFR